MNKRINNNDGTNNNVSSYYFKFGRLTFAQFKGICSFALVYTLSNTAITVSKLGRKKLDQYVIFLYVIYIYVIFFSSCLYGFITITEI